MKLSFKEVKRDYMEKNRECKFCEFASIEKTIINSWGSDLTGVNVENSIYCNLSEEVAERVCEYYQVKSISEDQRGLLEMNKNTVTLEQLESIYENAEKHIQFLWGKCTMMAVHLENGFTIVVHSACVDPKNFDETIGVNICKEKVISKLWELEGYKLQCELGKL